MPITPEQWTAAKSRLAGYNLEDYGAGNELGFGNDGHEVNLVPMWGDMVTAGQFAGEQAEAAETARAEVEQRQGEVEAGNAATVSAVTALRTATETAAGQAGAARDQAALYAAALVAAGVDVAARAGVPPCLDLSLTDPAAVLPQHFSRSSPAWRRRANGLLVRDPAGVIRIDHDPVTGAWQGARLEGGLTNPLPGVASWSDVLGNTTVTPGAAAGPDGTLSLDLLASAATAGDRLRRYSVAVPADTETRLLSVNAAPGAGRYLNISLAYSGGTPRSSLLTMDLLAATAVLSGGVGEVYGVEPAAGGTMRAWVGLANAGCTTLTCDLRPYQHPTATASGSVAVGWALLETGVTRPGSPVVYGTPRAADALTVPLADLPDWRAGGAWTLYVEARITGPRADSTRMLAAVSDGTYGQYAALAATPAGMHQVIAGSVQTAYGATGGSAVGLVRMALRVAAGSIACAKSIDGAVSPLQSSAGAAPAGLTHLYVGHHAGEWPLDGHVRRAVLWPAGLPDATLTALVTP